MSNIFFGQFRAAALARADVPATSAGRLLSPRFRYSNAPFRPLLLASCAPRKGGLSSGPLAICAAPLHLLMGPYKHRRKWRSVFFSLRQRSQQLFSSGGATVL